MCTGSGANSKGDFDIITDQCHLDGQSTIGAWNTGPQGLTMASNLCDTTYQGYHAAGRSNPSARGPDQICMLHVTSELCNFMAVGYHTQSSRHFGQAPAAPAYGQGLDESHPQVAPFSGPSSHFQSSMAEVHAAIFRAGVVPVLLLAGQDQTFKF